MVSSYQITARYLIFSAGASSLHQKRARSTEFPNLHMVPSRNGAKMQVTDGASREPSKLKVNQIRWMRNLHPLRPNSDEFAHAKDVTDLDASHGASSFPASCSHSQDETPGAVWLPAQNRRVGVAGSRQSMAG